MIAHSETQVTLADILSVIRILRSGQVNDSTETKMLVEDMQKYFGSRTVRAYPSGTRALIGAIKTLENFETKYVIAPSYVCEDVIDSIYACNLEPIICDIDPLDLNLDAGDIAIRLKKMSVNRKQVAAIIVPHMFGFPADIVRMQELKIPIIEDITHAIGGSLNNKKLGTFGDLTIFSLHALKVITAGEGGLLVSNVKNLTVSNNYGEHLSNINSALVRSQLRRLETINKKRSDIYEFYREKTREIFGEEIKIQTLLRGSPAYFRFVFLLPRYIKSEEIQYLYQSNGIVVRKPVKKMLHKLQEHGISGGYTETERVFASALSLPLHLKMRKEELNKVIKVTKTIFAERLGKKNV